MESNPEIRCCSCGRLLFKITGGALGCTVQIKCPRCRQFNILRPDVSPHPERHDRAGKVAGRVPSAPRTD
ncbi:MAG: Com family DNA-binding transcriptional regulator [Rhodobacterales bacterium]|nr:Com family DNA-binding transcriptional regulator [Rhodobacterales bacterium]